MSESGFSRHENQTKALGYHQKRYSKHRIEMLKYSVMLLMFKWNNQLDTILD